MNDRVFIDSNVLIYAYSEEEIKREKALDIIKMNESIISIQVINEFVNVVKKKFNKKNDEILEALEEIEEQLIIWGNYNLHLTKKAINLNMEDFETALSILRNNHLIRSRTTQDKKNKILFDRRKL